RDRRPAARLEPAPAALPQRRPREVRRPRLVRLGGRRHAAEVVAMSSSDHPPRIVCLPGDCIGPEVMSVAQRVLRELAPDLELEEHPFGGAAIRATGDPLPPETLEACRSAAAVLKAPIGDPEFDAADIRPEQGMLRLRSELDVYTNLRPA